MVVGCPSVQISWSLRPADHCWRSGERRSSDWQGKDHLTFLCLTLAVWRCELAFFTRFPRPTTSLAQGGQSWFKMLERSVIVEAQSSSWLKPLAINRIKRSTNFNALKRLVSSPHYVHYLQLQKWTSLAEMNSMPSQTGLCSENNETGKFFRLITTVPPARRRKCKTFYLL